MFKEVLKNYEQNKRIIEKDNEFLKQEIKKLQEPMTQKLIYNLNNNVSILHKNEKIIERESKEL